MSASDIQYPSEYPDLNALDMTLLDLIPLAPAGEIRLLDVQPGWEHDPLEVFIYRSAIGNPEPTPFEALSYVWGDTSNPVPLTVRIKTRHAEDGHGQEFSIGRNLATALRHLRHADGPRTIWADAICINQADYTERTQQVLMMGEIYRTAQKVIAFLGPEMDDSNYACEVIEKISRAIDVDYSTGLVSLGPGSSQDTSWADMRQPLQLAEREHIALFHYLHREWFERLWIRQEIGLGGDQSFLLCGKAQIPWSSFCRAIFVIHRKPRVTEALKTMDKTKYAGRVGDVDTIALYSMRAFSLINLRRQIGMSQCSDPRDRIYGVLSQLRKTDQVGIMPDYTKTAVEVYVDATQRHIRHNGSLAILCQCELTKARISDDLPTWVPDWSKPMPSTGVHEMDPPLLQMLPSHAKIGEKTLDVHALRCCKVVNVIRVNHDILDSPDKDSLIELRRLVAAVASIQGTIMSSGSDEDVLHALTCSIWLNNFAERWRPIVPHEPRYQECLALVRALAEGDVPVTDSLSNSSRNIGRACDGCRGRSLAIMDDGSLGMVPDSVEPGDEVFLVFSCWKPILLRPITSADELSPRYQVVGESYVHGQMHGEKILGKLPHGFRKLLNPSGVLALQSEGFENMSTGHVYDEDPRIKPFLQDLVSKGLLETATLKELDQSGVWDTLRKAGIPLEIITLI